MYRHNNKNLIFSASDLVAFLGCRHATYLDRRRADGLVALPEEVSDLFLKLLQDKGLEHERAYLEGLRAADLSIAEIPDDVELEERVRQTHAAMAAGTDVIYQGAFLDGRWHGYADFLVRVHGVSSLGDYHYEPVDTKLSHSPKPKHLIQLGIYAELLTKVQGRPPTHVHVALGHGGEPVPFGFRDLQYYLAEARARFEAFVDALPAESTGEPCNACDQCRWKTRCEPEWTAANHLTLVAGISTSQIEKLGAAGVTTMAALAALPPETRIERLQPQTVQKLIGQARLQEAKHGDGENHREILPLSDRRGFARLPKPCAGDLFFDMEGDPLAPGGLEYLFGFAYLENGQPTFIPFWGHDRTEEKSAFEAAMDFIMERLAEHPDAHIYHYGAYEESALKRLAMLHGTREAQVDNLLRNGKLIDLFKVVREALRISEPSYSLKNVEVFYMPPRAGEVQTASASVVTYEAWRKLGDGHDHLLREIEAYNRADCVSTLKLRDWLVTLRPEGLPWREEPSADAVDVERSASRKAAEERLADTAARLLAGPDSERPLRELVSQLLEFHHREAKPQWWWQFRRADMTEEELIEDAECIGGLKRDAATPPFSDKRSTVHTFTFPPQDSKMRLGTRPRRVGTLEPVGELIFLDEDARRLQLKAGSRTAPLPDELSLIPEPPLDDQVLREAIYRYAGSVAAADGRYTAITSVLTRALPRIHRRAGGEPVISAGTDLLAGALAAISALNYSHLLVQGPPGTGKTYLSGAAIVALLAQGKRVGVTSNSHKAINKLLAEVSREAQVRGVTVRGVKKCTDADDRARLPLITDVFDNDEVDHTYNLVAGTAWLFARQDHDEAFDYLFVDEAGQVSLANLVAVGLAARNLVLVGDQMQLAQPIQGTHPGRSGLSALEFLLEDHATVPLERGVFLDLTRRMHPDVCWFISEAVYEGRLHSHPDTAARKLLLGPGADPSLKPSGLSFVPVSHQGCRQKSEEEAARVLELIDSLLKQRWVNREGTEAPVTLQDILVVAPYNMQVNRLQSTLPEGVRVGTVDKFQGQEAAVVIVSMTTSSAEDAPRGMDFLFSRNRLNVAISRAQVLALVVASPKLLEAPCSSVEHVKLVNTLCFAHEYGKHCAPETPRQ
jgi:uncharacterized protein